MMTTTHPRSGAMSLLGDPALALRFEGFARADARAVAAAHADAAAGLGALPWLVAARRDRGATSHLGPPPTPAALTP